jgi:hypothetical protein
MANGILNWFNGLPSEGVEITANDSGSVKYWFNGLPSEYYFIAVAAGNIKSVSGVAWASVKKVSGVAEASIKKLVGITAN